MTRYLFPKLCGLAVILLAVLVMVGWLLHISLLVQLLPWIAPMQFNTAICVTLAGLSLIGISTGRRWLAKLCAVGAGIVSALTLLESSLHLNFGIDTLFMTPFLPSRTGIPGRMASNTAFDIVLIAFSLFAALYMRGRYQNYKVFAVALLGGLIFSIGLVPLFGYFTNIDTAYTAGTFVGMAALTALAFSIIGLGIIMLTWRDDDRSVLTMPVCAFVLITCATFALTQTLERHEDLNLRKLVQAQVDSFSADTKQYMDGLLVALDRIANRWDIANGTPRNLWEADAAAYLQAFPVLSGIGHADTNFISQWIVNRGQVKHFGYNMMSEPERAATIRLVVATGKPQASHTLTLLQGGKGFIYINPVYANGKFDGLVTAGFSLDNLFRTLMSKNLLANFNVTVEEQGVPVFTTLQPWQQHDPHNLVRSKFSIYDKSWDLTVSPRDNFIRAQKSALSGIFMIVGLLIAGLVALSIYLGLQAQQTARQLGDKQASLELARAEADRANAAKSDFLANMSHEIRTPMNGVMGMTHLLLNTNLNPQQQHYAETIGNSSEALLQIINDILDFSKIEAGKMELEHIAFDFQLLCEEVAELMAVRTQEKNIEFFLRFRPGCPYRIIGDPGRIRQILFNLCGNAVKFTDRGHVLLDIQALEVNGQHATLRVAVQDTGIGIPPEKQAQIFNKFDQADTSTTRQYGGTGLGLSIVRQLVHMIGGAISLRSAMGEGTEFSVELPVTLAPEQTRAHDVIPQLQGQNLRALIIDDNQISREIQQDILRSVNIDAVIVARPDLALERLREDSAQGKPFDFVILDYVMPVMNGVELAREIKAEPALDGILAILATSQPTRSDADGVAEAGIKGYMTKPVRASELLGIMATLWEAKQAGHTLGMVTRYTMREHLSDDTETEDVYFRDAAILLAEDNPVNQEVVAAMLAEYGIRTVVAVEGNDAVRQYHAQAFDLIFMDCQMPGMDGFEATHFIRLAEKDGEHVPIIALTANAMQADRERCLAAGMDDYLSKPVKELELTRMLLQWLPTVKRTRRERKNVRLGRWINPDITLPTLDENTIGTMRRLMKDKFDSVLDTFLGNTAKLIGAAGQGVVARDAAAVAQAAHSLTSSSGQLGAIALQEQTRVLESYAQKIDWTGIDTVWPMIEPQFAAVRVAIEQWRSIDV